VKAEADASPNFLGMFKPLEFDGVAEFILPDIKCFESARDDPFYKEKVAPDEVQFFSWPDTRWMLGWEEVYIKDGVCVDMPMGDTQAPGIEE
jgi:EthD domain